MVVQYLLKRPEPEKGQPKTCAASYFRVVGTHALGTVPSFYHLPLSQGVLVRFLRFRLGCHHLRVNNGRWVQPFVPRRRRFCLCCHSTCLDDEANCLLAPIPPLWSHERRCMQLYHQFFGTMWQHMPNSGICWKGC
jgi:hypothetical protein